MVRAGDSFRVAHLGRDAAEGFAALRERFVAFNPDYDLSWSADCRELEACDRPRVVFVHHGTGNVTVGADRSPVTVGDVVVLRPGASLIADAPLGLLAFTTTNEIDAAIPSILRPDHDPLITDEPGGCATAADAYRRVVLTWLGRNGPYNYRALNCHRVAMTDSFSHYHPREGGFDEMYLVQDVRPGGRVLVSEQVAAIEDPDSVTRDQAAELIREIPVETGDLVWVGRGAMHRALGGVLAHVVTVPGFIPGCEIGLDHHLRAIGERLGLSGEVELPYNAEASTRAVVK